MPPVGRVCVYIGIDIYTYIVWAIHCADVCTHVVTLVSFQSLKAPAGVKKKINWFVLQWYIKCNILLTMFLMLSLRNSLETQDDFFFEEEASVFSTFFLLQPSEYFFFFI